MADACQPPLLYIFSTLSTKECYNSGLLLYWLDCFSTRRLFSLVQNTDTIMTSRAIRRVATNPLRFPRGSVEPCYGVSVMKWKERSRWMRSKGPKGNTLLRGYARCTNLDSFLTFCFVLTSASYKMDRNISWKSFCWELTQAEVNLIWFKLR